MKSLSKGYKYVKDIDRAWAYILKDSYFYAQIPHSLNHFVRVFSGPYCRLTNPFEREIKRLLEKLVQEKKLIKVKNNEYMIHPQSLDGNNLRYVKAFSA